MSDAAKTFVDVIRNEIDDNQRTLYTDFPATIVSYDNQLATVKPTIDLRFADGDIVQLGIIKNVPVIFPAGGGGILSFPLKEGDPVWIMCSMFALEKWKETYQQQVTPDTTRIHSLNDAVCVPQIFPKNIRMGVSNDNVELVFNKVNPETKEVEEFLSGIKMLPDGSFEISNKFGSKFYYGADKAITVENTENGASYKILDDGKIELTSASTYKIQNGGEELVNLISELTQLLIDTTTNTQIGPMPLNNKAAISALKTRLDTLKG